MENPIIVQTDALELLNRSEIDVQIATAKRYPRELGKVLNQIETLATLDPETAESCFYAVRRGDEMIEGVSVRFAEIIASAWGNMRVQTRIIGNDGRKVTAQCVCHDLETNLAISTTTERRITNRSGQTYSEDMQIITANAASAIAFRNAVLKVVPKAAIKRIIDSAKQVALGSEMDLETGRKNALANFKKTGVTELQVLSYFGISALADLDKEKLLELKSLWLALKEDRIRIGDVFESESEIKKKAKDAKEAKKKKIDLP